MLNPTNNKGLVWDEADRRIIEETQPGLNSSSVRGVNMLSRYLYSAGGFAQQDRMIKDKRRTLDRAVLYSYQGAKVRKYIPDYIETMDGVRQDIPKHNNALINPNKLKPDYDDKVISVGYEFNLGTGDVFEWIGTDTYWLIYLQDLTELAYFKGDIRKCSYKIAWKDEDGNIKSTYAAVRGPVETKIEYIQKAGTSTDVPNYSLNMMIPKNKDTLAWCKRYARFLLSDGLNTVSWRIEAVDAYSMENIIQFNAVEYYINKDKDDIENQIIDGLEQETTVFKLENPAVKSRKIQGEGFIKPKKTYTYTHYKAGEWILDEKLPISYEIDGGSIILKWTSSYSGQFDLQFKDNRGEIETKTIIVESLF